MRRKERLSRPNGGQAKRTGKISELGLSAEERAYLREAKADDAWLNSRPPAFWEKYAEQYVAVRFQQVIAHSKSMQTLRRTLGAQRIRFVTISFIEDPSAVVVYAL
ncbi:MAG: hypothetical protein HY782_07435 [Chloroflexi bacterium]|nr:hypothetical protein [Chloroflexota bacterium]